MKITKCDRCGCEISTKKCKSMSEAIAEIMQNLVVTEVKYSITKYIDSVSYDIDLCEDCNNKFKAWMNPERIGTEANNDN